MGIRETCSMGPEEPISPLPLDCIKITKERDKTDLDYRQDGPESDLCQDLTSKVALKDANDARTEKIAQIARKIRLLLHKCTEKVGRNENEEEVYFTSALVRRLFEGKQLVQTPLHWKNSADLKLEESPLVERSPMRVSMGHHPYPEPYPHQQRSYVYNGGSRVEETEDLRFSGTVEDFLGNLTEPERNLLHEALDQFVTQNSNRPFNEPWHIRNQINDRETQQYPQNIQAWEDARHQALNGFRESHHSFSSSSSNSQSSESPSSSPDRSPYAAVSSPGSSIDLNLDCLIPTTVASVDNQPNLQSPVPGLCEEVSRATPQSVSASSEMLTPAKDSMTLKMNHVKKEKAWVRIQAPSIDELGQGDYEGDSQLMILLARKVADCLEYVYCIVERLLKEHPNYLNVTNKHDKDALRIAAEDLYTEPVIAAYIAEAFARAHLPVQKVYNDGETLLHKLARLGDTHSDVLKNLLNLRLANGNRAFDGNARNKEGLTPLHVACACHRQGELDCARVVQVLFEAEVDPLAQDYVDKNTPLHTLVNGSGDIRVVNIFYGHLSRQDLLQQAAEAANRQQNTVLHLACSKNKLSKLEHCRLVQTIVNHGGQIHLKNNNGQVPSYLVELSRKADIKAILHAKMGKPVGDRLLGR